MMTGSSTFDCYVGNLPLHYTENEIRGIFAIAGEIVGIKILPAKGTADGKVAFVRFLDESDAHCCAQYMNNHCLDDGRLLKVRYRAKSQDEKAPMSTGTPLSKEGDDMEQVFVSHVESPVEFWAQPCSEIFAVQLQELTENMESICPYQPKVIGQLSTDLVYGCKFSEDNLWYRCIVEKAMAKNEVHVRYIDYGNAEVTDRFGLVTLPKNLATMPAMCERYQIEGLELSTNDVQSEAYEKGLDLLIELINEERILIKMIKKDKDMSVAKIYQDADGVLMDIPTKLMPTGAVKVKVGGQLSSFATAVKTPVKNIPSLAEIIPKANCYPYSSVVVSNGTESSLKTATNHVLPESPARNNMLNNQVKLTESPPKTNNYIKCAGTPPKSTNDQIKLSESPGKSLSNYVAALESPVKPNVGCDWFSEPSIDTVIKPAKSHSDHLEGNKSGVSSGEVKVSESEYQETEPRKSISDEDQRCKDAVAELTMSAEVYKERIEDSAKIIEILRKQLDEKTKNLENYLQKKAVELKDNAVSKEINNNLLDCHVSECEASILYPVVCHGHCSVTKNMCETADTKTDSDDEYTQETMPQVSFKDIGGCKKEMHEVKSIIDLPLRHNELFTGMAISPPRGVLISGPHGTGKTLIARAVANESQVFMKEISGSFVVSSSVEDSKRKLDKAFKDVMKNAPAILIIDGIDLIAPKKEIGENKIVAKLVTLLNQLKGNIAIISTAIRSDDVDSRLIRAGLFDKEITLSNPDVTARLEILRIILNKVNLSKAVCMNKLSEELDGYTGSNISTLCTSAVMHAVNSKISAQRGSNTSKSTSLKQVTITMTDFKYAKDLMHLSNKKVVVEVPNLTWDDIHGMDDVKDELRDLINHSVTYEEKLLDIGGPSSKGLLLCGLNGCGKKMFAQAVCNECKCKFLSVKVHELSATTNGKGSVVADTFSKARQNAPCMLYIDEIELITTSNNLLNKVLKEIDSVGMDENVFIVGGTSRLSEVHPAFRRDGRLKHIVQVPLPDKNTRMIILERGLEKKNVAEEIHLNYLEKLAEELEGLTTNDLQNILHKVYKLASKENICCYHFDEAIKVVRRSITSNLDESRESILESQRNTDPAAIDDKLDTLRGINSGEVSSDVKSKTDTIGNNYMMLLGLFTIACFIYLCSVYIIL